MVPVISTLLQVEGYLKYVSSGDKVVVGVSTDNKVYVRVGISSSEPTGKNRDKRYLW
jgi:hypothetical protein